MTETELEDAVLAYLSRNGSEAGAFQSLTTIYEKLQEAQRLGSELDEDDRGIDDKEQVRAALDQLVMDGMVESRWGERDYEASYRITDQGAYEAAFPDGALVTHSDGTTFSDGSRYRNGPASERQEVKSFDSAAWTGLPSAFVLDEQKSAKLVSLLQAAEQNLDRIGAGNAEKAMARAYIVAAQALADAPDPPADLIWEIINRANNLAGVASLFISIIALFTAAH